MKNIQLGHTSIHISPLGMGTLTMGFSQKNLSLEEGAGLITYGVKNGIRFLDTAQYYETYPYIRLAFQQLRQEGIELPVVCSRSLTEDYQEMKNAVQEALDTLELSCIDLFLLHEVRGAEDFQQRAGAWRALQEMKEAGLVKAIGISTHHVDAVERMAQGPLDPEEAPCDVVFVMLNKNSLGIRRGQDPATKEDMEAAIQACSAKGMGVFSMKAFGGGNLTAEYIPCLDYVTKVPGNQCVMMGLASKEEIDTAIAYFEGTLSPSYAPDVSQKRMMVEQSDCEGCGACKARCSSQAIYWNENGLAAIDQTKCVRCGYCAPVCPVRAILLL